MRLKQPALERVDVAMVGTFAAWRLGTLQSRALPLAIALREHGIRCAIVTVPWDQAAERGVEDSISGLPVMNTRRASVLGSAPAVAEQSSLVRGLNPRIVHVFKPKGFGGMTALTVGLRPLLVDSDDWEGDGGWNQLGSYNLLQRRVFDLQERMLLRRADGVTAASTLLTHRARSLRPRQNADTVRHVPNGLSRSWSDLLLQAGNRRRTAGPDSVPRVVLYTRFAEFPPAWLGSFVAALEMCVDQRVEIVVLGDTKEPHFDTGLSLVKVNLMGYVARNTIPDILASAPIAIYPFSDTLVARSKHSVKLLELMSAGCAVVASDVGDIPSVLGDAGIVVSDSSPQSFAEVVARLAQRPDLVSTMKRTGQSRVETLFAIDKIAGNLTLMYRSCLGDRS